MVNMFHVFQSHQPGPRPNKRSIKQSQQKPRSRPVKIPHACTECKRRKIRCDGGHPCGKCVSRDVGSTCTYARQRERIHPSKKKLDGLSRALEEHRTIVDRLFPEHDVADLLSLPRHDLIDILILSDHESVPSLSTSWLSTDQESTSTATSWLPSPPPDLTPFDYQEPELNAFMMNATPTFNSFPSTTDYTWPENNDESLLLNAQFGGTPVRWDAGS